VKEVKERTQTVGAIGVAVFNDHDRPPRRFASGRVCADYDRDAYLSIYNKGSCCSLHALGVVRVRGKKAI
jgi:hypothetical protein